MNCENKAVRRMLVLQKILQTPKIRRVSCANKPQIQIDKPPVGLQKEFDALFTKEALTFLSEIITKFEYRIDQLYWNRCHRKLKLNSNFSLPSFLNTPQRRDKTWKIKALPAKLNCRHVDLGDVSPANIEHFREALGANVNGIQVDFDDGHCPTWTNQIVGLYNVYCIVHGLLHGVKILEQLPVLMLRPRAWNMMDHNIMINGKKLPGPLVDFAVLMFHNAQRLWKTGSGPFLYLSKLEGAEEAKLWNDIFIWTQDRLGLPQGTIKACVLIENILACYEMDEILYELKDHSLGLNCGIWDYAASIINKFGHNPDFVLPDRNKYVNMDKHFLKKYMELVVQTCHDRGAPATGGMAALLITNQNNSNCDVIEKVVNDKLREIKAGCDGFMVYDTKLIPYVQKLWQEQEYRRHEVCVRVEVSAGDLLSMPRGCVTLCGLRHNVCVALMFICAWLQGRGHFAWQGAIEDSATAEISRSQLWQWIKHQATIEDTGEIVTKTLVETISTEIVKEHTDTSVGMDYNLLLLSKNLFMDLVTARYFIDFITSYLNDNCIFRQIANQQNY